MQRRVREWVEEKENKSERKSEANKYVRGKLAAASAGTKDYQHDLSEEGSQKKKLLETRLPGSPSHSNWRVCPGE